jgi:hypothetical protein
VVAATGSGIAELLPRRGWEDEKASVDVNASGRVGMKDGRGVAVEHEEEGVLRRNRRAQRG